MKFTLFNHWTRKHWVYSLFGLLFLLAIYRCGGTGFDEETDVRIFVDGLNSLTVPASMRGGESVTLTAAIDRITTERSVVEWSDGGIGGSFSAAGSPVTLYTAPATFNGQATIILSVYERCSQSDKQENCFDPTTGKGLFLNSKVTKIPVSTFTAYDFFLGQGVRFDPSSRVVTSFEDTQVGDDGPEVVILKFFNFHYILNFISFVQHQFTLNLIGPDGGIRTTFEGVIDSQFSNVNVTVAEQTEEITAGELNRGTWIYELFVDGRLYNITQNDSDLGPLSKTFTALREGDDLPFFETEDLTANGGGDQSVTAGNSIVLNGSGSTSENKDRPLFFNWTILDQPENSNPSFTNTDSLFPTFKAEVDGIYVIQLVVSDGVNTSVPDLITITVNRQTSAPNAVIAGGDRTVTVSTEVALDGTDSNDPNGDSITWTWSFLSVPAGNTATFSSASDQVVTFMPNKTGQYFIQLVVSDGTESDTEVVEITVTS